MSCFSVTLKIILDNNIWIGIFERIDKDRLSVAKVIFYCEPKDYEVYKFINNNYYSLKFSSEVYQELHLKKENPKRMNRRVSKEIRSSKLCSKSKELLKIQYESFKIVKKRTDKADKEQQDKIKFLKKQQKKKDKHKGR